MPIPVTDLIDTTAPSDTYATHNSTRGKGGLHEVADITARDAITAERRTEGMLSYVQSEGAYYALDADLVTWTSLGNTHQHNGSDVLLPADTGLTHTLTNLNTYGHSAGILYAVDFDGLVTASGTAGSVDIAAFGCYFRTSASSTAELKYYSLAATTVAIPTDTTSYIVANYSAGTPTITATASDTTDGYISFTLAFVENVAGVVHMIIPLQDRFNDHSHIMIQRMWEAMGVERVAGAVIGQPANLKVSVTAGTFWAKASRFTSLAFDSNTATGANSGTFFTYYYNGTAWVEAASLTALPVTQYNNIASGLTTMVSNRWSYYDVYLGVNDGDVRILYGQAQYTSQADASVAPLSAILPNEIGEVTYQFIGRLVFQKSAASFALVLSAYATELSAAGITDHNALANLQGGASNDYSHLTSAQYVALTDGGATTLHTHNVNINQTMTLAAGEDLVVGDPVYISANTFLKADNVTNFRVMGVVTTAALTGLPAVATLSGQITLSGLTPSAPYFLGAGIITATAPSSGYVVRMGQAASTATLILNIEEPIYLT